MSCKEEIAPILVPLDYSGSPSIGKCSEGEGKRTLEDKEASSLDLQRAEIRLLVFLISKYL